MNMLIVLLLTATLYIRRKTIKREQRGRERQMHFDTEIQGLNDKFEVNEVRIERRFGRRYRIKVRRHHGHR